MNFEPFTENDRGKMKEKIIVELKKDTFYTIGFWVCAIFSLACVAAGMFLIITN